MEHRKDYGGQGKTGKKFSIRILTEEWSLFLSQATKDSQIPLTPENILRRTLSGSFEFEGCILSGLFGILALLEPEKLGW